MCFHVVAKWEPGYASSEVDGGSKAACEGGAGWAASGVNVGSKVSSVKDNFNFLPDGRPYVVFECPAGFGISGKGERFAGGDEGSEIDEVLVHAIECMFKGLCRLGPIDKKKYVVR